MKIEGKIKTKAQIDADIALAQSVHAQSFVDPDHAETVRDDLHAIAQTLLDEFYPELTHLRIDIDASREWLACAQPEGVA